jgi:hypothetical protein
MKFTLTPARQIDRTSPQKSTRAGPPGQKHSKADEKSASNASETIKRVIFGDKSQKARPVQCRPVDEEREKREYRVLLQEKIAEREKLRKVR